MVEPNRPAYAAVQPVREAAPIGQSPNGANTQRLLGIDLARFVAIVGMMAAHLLVPRQGGFDYEYNLSPLDVITSGFPSTLFAVLGGFGIVFTSRKYLDGGLRSAAVINLLVRGAVIVVIGLVLELFPDHPIAVILVYYGVATMLAAPFILLPNRVLVMAAAILTVVGSTLNYAIYVAASSESPYPGGDSLVTDILAETFFTGTYPATTWLTYFLMGMVACRYLTKARGLQARRDRSAVVIGVGAGGFAAAELLNFLVMPAATQQLARLWYIDDHVARIELLGGQYGLPAIPPPLGMLVATPHTGSIGDVLRTGGMALVITGLLTLLTTGFKEAPVALRPLAGMGGAPLTIYVLHIVITALAWNVYLSSGNPWEFAASGSGPWLFHYEFWVQLALFLGIGAVLSFTHKRGPLEVATSDIARAVANHV